MIVVLSDFLFFRRQVHEFFSCLDCVKPRPIAVKDVVQSGKLPGGDRRQHQHAQHFDRLIVSGQCARAPGHCVRIIENKKPAPANAASRVNSPTISNTPTTVSNQGTKRSIKFVLSQPGCRLANRQATALPLLGRGNGIERVIVARPQLADLGQPGRAGTDEFRLDLCRPGPAATPPAAWRRRPDSPLPIEPLEVLQDLVLDSRRSTTSAALPTVLRQSSACFCCCSSKP